MASPEASASNVPNDRTVAAAKHQRFPVGLPEFTNFRPIYI
jgi:hypothetical protein